MTDTTPAVTLDTLEDLIVDAFTTHELTPHQDRYYIPAGTRDETCYACAIGAATVALLGAWPGSFTAFDDLVAATGIDEQVWRGIDAAFTYAVPDSMTPHEELPDIGDSFGEDAGEIIGLRIAARVLPRD